MGQKTMMKNINMINSNYRVKMESPNENKSRISSNLISTRANDSRKLTNGAIKARAITIALLISACACHSALAYNDGGGYDPEQQDGIPVFSARSVPRPASASSHDDDWSNNGDSELTSAQNQPMAAQRRQSDGDLDDGLEDDEEDEYKSGSSPRESIESPGYGESRRFARDGDDIEEFFDRHLGPPQEAAVTAESAPGGSQYMVPAVDPDDDDEYEAAASGPLATIFHSLLGHTHDHKHTKRPFLQIATSSSSDPSDSSSSDSDASPSGKSSKSGNLKASQSAQSYVEAAPIALALTPLAAPSTIAVQEPAGQESQEGNGHEQDASGHPGSSGVREIYIGRRPTVMSYLQQAHAVQQQQQQQQASLPAYYSAGSANVWRGPNGRPMMYEQEQSADYARHPVAASYAYQREQPTGASSATSPVADDEQTVTYGLSFGGGGGSSDSKDEHAADQEAVDQPGEADSGAESPDAQQAGYVPYNTKYTTSSTRARNNYYQQQYGPPAPAGYMGVYQAHSGQQARYYQPQQVMMVQQQPQQHGHHPHYQQQYAAGATRYHRDPSESTNHLAAMRAAHMGISYNGGGGGGNGQHRGLGEQRNVHAADSYGEQRQRLLASLDREIKSSPLYRQNADATAATAPNNLYTRRPPITGRHPNNQHLVAFRTVKESHLGDGDLDTFKSYHSEVDPYRTYTKTSHMIDGSDPLAFLANTRQPSLQSEPDRYGLSGSLNGIPQQATSRETHATDANDNKTTNSATPLLGSTRQNSSNNLLTGPLTNYEGQQAGGDLLRTSSQPATPNIEISKEGQGLSGEETNNSNHGLSRVRRDDSDEREIDDDNDDDGVWVDDDGDDDNRQQSSDLNETSQEPEEEEEEEDGQQDAANNVPSAQQVNPPGVIGAPHGYELWPNDAMVYNG